MDKVEQFKEICRYYFSTLPLASVQAYGRDLGLCRPTGMKKADLIEEILKVLCGGEVEPRNARGAPIKNTNSGTIAQEIEALQKKYLSEILDKQTTVVKEQKEPAPALVAERIICESAQIVIQFSDLTKEQKKLFMKFLKSV